MRGVAINVVFLLVVEVANLANGLIVARLLGPSDIGLYGIVSITATTLIALKRVGIDEAYVQQDEANQELEFHLAFTLELVLGILFAVLLLIAAPILVAVYDEGELLWLTLAVSYLPIAFALQAPLWVFFRRMDFIRQRSLQAIVPVVSFLVTVPMVIAGVGVWALVIGPLVANVVACFFAIRLSPYKLRVRWDRTAAKRYFAFSWPVFVVTACGLLIGQGQVLIFNIHGGLEATGFLALAAVLTRYADRADQVISPTIYPAICAVRDSEPTLDRIFVDGGARGGGVVAGLRDGVRAVRARPGDVGARARLDRRGAAAAGAGGVVGGLPARLLVDRVRARARADEAAGARGRHRAGRVRLRRGAAAVHVRDRGVRDRDGGRQRRGAVRAHLLHPPPPARRRARPARAAGAVAGRAGGGRGRARCGSASGAARATSGRRSPRCCCSASSTPGRPTRASAGWCATCSRRRGR